MSILHCLISLCVIMFFLDISKDIVDEHDILFQFLLSERNGFQEGLGEVIQ